MVAIERCLCCAVVWFAFMPGTSWSQANDPFGEVGGGEPAPGAEAAQAAPPADSPFGEPADTTAAPPVEKSVLIELPEVRDKSQHQDICRCIGESRSEAVHRIEGALRGPLQSNGLDFVEVPLEEVVNVLQEDYSIPIQLDLPALEATGLSAEEKMTANIHNVSLRSALRLILKRHQLTYIIQDEVLIITTPEEAENRLVTCVYDLRGVTEDTSEATVRDAIDTIVACVATETWAKNGGGEAEIRALKPGLIIVSQTQAVHEEIVGLLDTIRDVRTEKPAEMAADDAHFDNADAIVTRAYVLQAGQAADSEHLQAKIRELIVQAIPDEQWEGRLDGGQPVILTVMPDRVVLRHRPAIHQAVEDVLIDSGMTAPNSPGRGISDGESGGGGRGFFNAGMGRGN
jgi:hypothetical protein